VTQQQRSCKTPQPLPFTPDIATSLLKQTATYISDACGVACAGLAASNAQCFLAAAQASIKPSEVLHDSSSTGSDKNSHQSNLIHTSSSCPSTTSTAATSAAAFNSSTGGSSSNSSEISSSCYAVDNLACPPRDLLARVLSLLPLPDRLVSCAAACLALQAAALADLVVPFLTKQQHADAFAAGSPSL
jgi:hypothetical protein